MRLDDHILYCGLTDKLKEAQAWIMTGQVLVNNQKRIKPGTEVKTDDVIRLLVKNSPYVSRAGLKLKTALDTFDVPIKNRVCLDIGLSTGGFSDCLFKHGAKAIFGVDVGYGLLDHALRQQPNLLLLERTNARLLTKAQLESAAKKHAYLPAIVDDIELVVMDVSFISITKIIPTILDILHQPLEFICLLKPQFEADKSDIPAGGVVTDVAVIELTIQRVTTQLEHMGLMIKQQCPSAVRGQKGNQEWLLWLQKI